MGCKVQISEIAKVKGGKRLPKGVHLQSKQNAHPYIRVRDFNCRTLELNDAFEYVDDETQKSIRQYIVSTGDVLVTIVGTIGLTAIVGQSLDGASLTENCVKISGLDSVDSEYLYYYLSSPFGQQEIARRTVGAVQPKLPIKNIRSMEIDYPTREERERIVALLSLLDDKVEFNSRINDYLAELVRAEFSYRFGSGTPTTNLGDVMSISTQSLKPSACAGEIWEHYSIPAFDESRRPVFEPADGIKSNKYVIDNNCILISKLNPSTKRLWLPFCTSERPVCSTEFIVYKPKKPEHKSFYYAAVDSAAFTDFLLAHVTGSTGSRQRTQPKATLNYPTPNPSVEEIEDFCGFADPIIAKWQLNEQESAQLESLRDALLPKLMSGEIDVSEVELPTLPNNHFQEDE